MYTQSAKYYDAIYRASGKSYEREAERITQIIEHHGRSGGNRLLDVACGTGKHIEHLRDRFDCEGLDIARSMIEIASKRNPGVPVHLSDMIGFNLSTRFDAIICLFSAIAYAPNVTRLDQTLQTFVRHLQPGGVVIVEPWLPPEKWQDGAVHGTYADEPDFKVARMNVSRRDGNVAVLDFHYMIASRDGIRTFTEAHRLTLFREHEYRAAFERARLRVQFEEPDETFTRGLYIGHA